MKISKHFLVATLVIIVMVVGKACGYSEELIMDSIFKSIIGFEILVNVRFTIQKVDNKKTFTLEFFTKN